MAYATAAERMLRPSASPQTIDTRNDPRLSRIFANKIIKIYPAFAEFYGMEDSIEQVVSLLPPCGAGLEKKQILYLLGPVGGGKSSIAERLKQLMGGALLRDQGSPVNESPLGLFDAVEDGPILEKEYGIPRRYLNRIPVTLGRETSGGVRRRHPQVQGRQALPSVLKQVGIAKTEPGDENNQDISAGRQGRHPQARDLRAGRPRTPTASPAACAWPTRACSSSSRCSRRRSRCCTRC